MRESFGGAFMIKIMMVFIVVYISFMAVAINYAKAFRVKNNVINILEQYKYSGHQSDKAIDKLKVYLPKVPYKLSGIEGKLRSSCKKTAESEHKSYVFVEDGVCIIENKSASNLKYFKVITYISIDFPFFNIQMTFPIVGETKSIYS